MRPVVATLALLLCACTAPVAAPGVPVERPPLPSGPGPLLGTDPSYPDFLRQLERLGMELGAYEAQDRSAVIDVRQEVAFVAAEDTEDPHVVSLQGASIAADDIVVIQYDVESCLMPVGGSTAVADGAADITFVVGTVNRGCDALARTWRYRATLYVPGARESMPVRSSGVVVPDSVLLPLLGELPDLVIWPDLLPPPP